MNKLRLTLFGSLQATLNGRPIDEFRTRKVQALFYYLAIEPQPHAREHLLNLLWPGLPEKSARSNLRQILYYLRQAIPELDGRDGRTGLAVIIANRQDIQLNHEADITVDVQQFERLLDATQSHEHLDLYLCRECRQKLEESVNLYQGNFLTDFYLDDSNEYEEWAQSRREYFRRRVLDALEILTTMTMRVKEYPAAQAFTEKQLEIDNLRENAYRQLMAILALSGRREQALAVYERCRRVLIEELGMEPTLRTTEYYEKILAGDLQFDRFDSGGVRGYELKEQIGEGAYGAIHRAVQPSVKREVAIKVIRRRYADDPEFIRRFDTEAQTIARLEHPYIVPLYDYWRDPQGAYLVMRYMRGGSLLGELKSGPWNVERTAEMLEQIAGALTIAHRQGVVHRDIKPGNILLDEAGNAYLADFGIAKDLTREKQTAEGSVMGTLDYASPEQITGGAITPQTDMYSLGAVIYETLTGEKPFSDASVVQLLHSHLHEPIPLVAATRPDVSPDIDAVLQKATAKVPGERYATVLEMAAAFRSVTKGKHIDTSATIVEALPALVEVYNPYKGLYAFQESDVDDFYGREALVQQLVGRLQGGHNPQDGRFLAVVGPSGSGKSSVVKAGLIPALRKNALPNADKWFITEMVPGNNPLDELELALWRIAVNPPPNLVEPMKRDSGGILRTIRRILPDERSPQQGGSQLVLVIDQFEELFTLVTNEEQRNFFLESLLHAIEAPRSPLRVVITLRADFYDRPLQHPQWGQLLKQHTEIVLPLNRTELTWAIREPAQRLGVRLEEGLPAAIVADVADQPGALPLLQYAMTELFERRDGRQISHAAYAQLGGVLGALGRRAEAIYDELDEISQQMAQQVFLRLITLGEGSEDTRRRVLQLELEALAGVSEPDQQALAIVLERFGDARFLTFDRDPLTRVPTVEVAHEALIREWSRLRVWLTESRNDVRLQRLLAQTAAEWLAAEQDDGFLLRDARLDQFAGWAETTSVALTANEQAFIDASLAARQARQAEEEARQLRELETARQLAETEKARAEAEHQKAAEQARRAEEQAAAAQSLQQRAYFLIGAVVIAAVLAIAAFGFARSSTNNANLAATRAAEALRNADLAATSEADALANADLAATREAEAEANANLALTREGEAETERQAAVSAQATAEAEAHIRATAEARAVENETLAREQLALTTSRELALAANANLDINPERSLLLGLEALNYAYTTEAEEVVRAGLQASRIKFTLTVDGGAVNSIAYHPNENKLFGMSTAGLVIWNSETGEQAQMIAFEDIPSDELNKITISPDGSQLALTWDSKILIIDSTSREVIYTLEGHTDVVDALDFSPDGTLLASAGYDTTMRVWDMVSGQELYTVIASPDGAFGGQVDAVDFSLDGSLIATAGDDLTARIWDTETGEELTRFNIINANWVSDVTFNADGTRLFVSPGAGGSRAGELEIWDATSDGTTEGSEPLFIWKDEGHFFWNVELSPDGRYLASYAFQFTPKIWDATSETPVEVLSLLGQYGDINDLAFSPDSATVATVNGGAVRIWDISEAGGGEVQNIAHPSAPIALRPDTNTLFSATLNGQVYKLDASTGAVLGSFDAELTMRRPVFKVSADGRYYAGGGTNGVLAVWDLITMQEVFTRTAHGPGNVGGLFEGIVDVALSPDGQWVVSGGGDGYVRVWETATGDLFYERRADPRLSFWSEEELPNGVTHVTISPDGRLLAASTDQASNGDDSFSSFIVIWDLASGEEIATWEGSPRRIWALAFSPDSRQLVSSGGGGFVRVWEATTGEQLIDFEGITALISRIYYSADGRYLITNGPATGVGLWDIASQEPLLRYPQANTWPQSQGFPVLSADGRYLAATGANGIHIYTLDFQELVTIAESRVTRPLTDAECKEYLHVDACPTD